MDHCEKCEQKHWALNACALEDVTKVTLLRRIADITTPIEKVAVYAQAYAELSKSKHQTVTHIHQAAPLRRERKRNPMIGEPQI